MSRTWEPSQSCRCTTASWNARSCEVYVLEGEEGFVGPSSWFEVAFECGVCGSHMSIADEILPPSEGNPACDFSPERRLEQLTEAISMAERVSDPRSLLELDRVVRVIDWPRAVQGNANRVAESAWTLAQTLGANPSSRLSATRPVAPRDWASIVPLTVAWVRDFLSGHSRALASLGTRAVAKGHE